MAKKVETWMCDVCKEEWRTQSDAEKCEARHIAVVDTRLKYENGPGSMYPEAVVLTFGDGTIRSYYFE